MELDPRLIGGFPDEKPISPNFSKTFRTIRKHLTRTTNNENDMRNLTEEIHGNFPKQTITTVTIKRTLPPDQSISSFANDFPRNSFEYLTEKFPKPPKDDIYHQTMTSKQGVSTTYTTYSTRTVTVHSNSGALKLFFYYYLNGHVACLCFFCT
jgi:hypothetical protein